MFPQNGRNIFTETTISFRESYTGTEQSFVIDEANECPQCSGQGKVAGKRCTLCQGKKTVVSERLVTAVIPAGISQRMDVCVPAAGNPGLHGGFPGDLYVTVNIEPDPAYGRDGNDLYICALVDWQTAMAGGPIWVRMPDDEVIDVHCAQVLVDGERVTVANLGMPDPETGERGILSVAIKIVSNSSVPTPPDLPSTDHRGTPVEDELTVPAPPVPVNPSSISLESPSIVAPDHYRLLHLLGTGGFADVFLAEHIYLQTYVAIKRLRERLAPQDEQDFLKEAQTIAALRHPHIVRVLDFGISSSTATPYLVMDYIAQGTLRDRHQQGECLPFPLIVSYVKQIAEALQYAHDHDVIHRDIKPANILVDKKMLFLSDFGIAVTAHRTQSLSTQDAVGTVTYMAPEQISKKPRKASDQYALAVMVYEWLSGTPPFTGTSIQVAMSHLADPPQSLQRRFTSVSSSLEAIVFQALAKDPNARFPTVRAFADALAHA